MSARRLPPALVALSPGDLVCRSGEKLDFDSEGSLASAAERRYAGFLRALELTRESGLSGLLLRESALTDREFLALAQAARKILGEDGWLGIHDRGHLVLAARADALHVGFRSLAPAVARTILDPSVAIGFSAHAGDDPDLWRASDYIVFGPVLETRSKRGLKAPVGFEGLTEAAAASPVPVWGIGGLRPEHVARVRAAGARGLAVLSGIFGAADAAAACREYTRALAAR